MPKVDPVLTRLRKICLSLPDTEETPTWGQPHFRVCGKIFVGFGEHKKRTAITLKLPMALADMVIDEPHFSRAPYVGQHGWISLDVAGATDWRRIRSMVLESYGLIAPKRTLAKLESPAIDGAAAKKIKTKRSATRKSNAKQGSASTRVSSRKKASRARR
jgi:predicted DNA-binding protein (MmcQ/YjbR family)